MKIVVKFALVFIMIFIALLMIAEIIILKNKPFDARTECQKYGGVFYQQAYHCEIYK